MFFWFAIENRLLFEYGLSLLPEQACYVFHLVVFQNLIHTLVGASAVQSAQMAYVWSHLNVVEVGQLNVGR